MSHRADRVTGTHIQLVPGAEREESKQAFAGTYGGESGATRGTSIWFCRLKVLGNRARSQKADYEP